MGAFTLKDLRDLLRSAAGEDESMALDGDVLGADFTELGYDSLALMEAASLLQRERGIDLPEEDVVAATTPGAFLSLVNGRIPVEGTAG